MINKLFSSYFHYLHAEMKSHSQQKTTLTSLYKIMRTKQTSSLAKNIPDKDKTKPMTLFIQHYLNTSIPKKIESLRALLSNNNVIQPFTTWSNTETAPNADFTWESWCQLDTKRQMNYLNFFIFDHVKNHELFYTIDLDDDELPPNPNTTNAHAHDHTFSVVLVIVSALSGSAVALTPHWHIELITLSTLTALCALGMFIHAKAMPVLKTTNQHYNAVRTAEPAMPHAWPAPGTSNAHPHSTPTHHSHQ